MMNGNFTNPQSFTAGTKDLVMRGPLVAENQTDVVPVKIEVKLLDGAGKVIESCDSNGNTFVPTLAPGSTTWTMTKNTDKVAPGDVVDAHGTARDDHGDVRAEWHAQVDIA
jgi:hypothetical protein